MRPPNLTLPSGAWDSHCHIIGPFDRFPLPVERSYTPEPAPQAALAQVHARLGIDRAVIVQSQAHGFDHAPLLAALETGAGRYRGVCLLAPDATVQHVRQMDAAGICGVRFNFVPHLGGPPRREDMRAALDLARPFGWHVCLHVSGHDVVSHSRLIRDIDLPVVIDHMGRPFLEEGPEGPAVQEICRLLDTGRVWVKLSGADRLSQAGAPYFDAVAIAQKLASHAPDRMLWGTDWPHVNLKGPRPDDADLLDLISWIVPRTEDQRLVLLENPSNLFGYSSAAANTGR